MVTEEEVENALAVYSAVALDADAADDAFAEAYAAEATAKAAAVEAYDKAVYLGGVCNACLG